MVISIFSALLLLVSSSLLLNEVTHLANYQTPLGKVDLCKALRHAGKQSCGHLQIAAVRSFHPRVSIFFSSSREESWRTNAQIIAKLLNEPLDYKKKKIQTSSLNLFRPRLSFGVLTFLLLGRLKATTKTVFTFLFQICGFSAMVLFIGDFLVYYFKLTL